MTVQIIEQTDFAVRSSVMTLAKSGSEVRFVVVPMLHLGTPAFYKTVRRRLESCDQIVVEGVGGRQVRVMTLAYRMAGRFGRGGLVTQSKGLDLTGLDDRLVRPDLTAAQFATGWKKIARPLRWALLLFAPFFGLWMLIVGPRRALGRNVGLDDLPTREEQRAQDANEAVDAALLGDRDHALAETLTVLAAEEGPAAVGVCWGAEHVRAIMQVLPRLGYRIVDATWVTVFS
jgi:hypothetical protein